MDILGNLEIRWAQGLTNSNVEFVDKETVCYTSGNCIVLLNLEKKIRTFLQCPGRGIGVFTANGHSKTLALSDHKHNPSIFVYSYPELILKCDLRGTASLDYTAIALSDVGPYLACCSGIPDHTITIWNWEGKVPLCNYPQAGKDITTLAFNPMNWHQLCALNATSVTVWNVERSGDFHLMKPSFIDLPATDGSVVEREENPSHPPSGKLHYYGPQMPTSAMAGLVTQKAESIVPQRLARARLSPTALCWSASSDLYVGCREGHLLLVHPESLQVNVLLGIYGSAEGPPAVGSDGPALQKGSFQCLALHGTELFAAGDEGVLQNLQMKGNRAEVVQTLSLEEPVSAITFSPDYETLLLVSSTGSIYTCKPSLADKVQKVLEAHCGDFVAAACLYTDKNLCVSVRESGMLQLWSMDAGICVGSFPLQTQVTSLACCPTAQYVTVGTVTGHVLFLDLTKTQEPRLVHEVHLYHVPVEHLTFDQGGNFLVTGAADSHIFVLNAKPSKRFTIIGYTECVGATVSLSAQYRRDRQEATLLVLCERPRKEGAIRGQKEGDLLELLTLSVQQLNGPVSCADNRGCLPENILQRCQCEVPHALTSCVLGTNQIFGYCHQKRTIQTFRVPESAGKTSDPDGKVRLEPENKVKGHPLGPATLLLSPHNDWLASVGRDGLLCVREVATMESCVQAQCHSDRLGGARSVAFTLDSQTLVTTGLRDGSLICSSLRLMAPVGKANAATLHGKALATTLEKTATSENPILSDMANWEPVTQSSTGSGPFLSHTEEARDQEDSATDLPSAAHFSATWLQRKLEAAIKEESQLYSDTKQGLRQSIREIRDTIREMILENENLPDEERLELQDFNLDVEEQSRLQAEAEQEISRVRNEIEMENLAKAYLREVLKRECWDSMKVKGQSIKAFHLDREVKNYPMKERTAEELEELHRVECIRKIEQADANLQKEILESRSRPPAEREEEEEEEEGGEVDIAATVGSLSAQYGGSNPLLYNQFDLHVREQKINQITLLQDVIYRVRTAFNKEFDAARMQKVREIGRVRDRNRRIKEIMAELDLTESLWEPVLTENESPERALTVTDAEIEVENYLTPEQRQREEERRKEEERRRLAAKADSSRDQALDDMMRGVLELKREDVLKMEVPQPEFMSKPDLQWTEEERKSHRDYEKKVQELSEEKEKHRKTLEAEMKKLQASVTEATQAFDEILIKLFERKVKSEMVIYQEELKIANLVYGLLIEEEILNRDKELSHKLERARFFKNETGEDLKKYREDVDAFRETYDNVVAEDKLLDKGFHKEFGGVPGHLVDLLYKLFKRRPRVQRMRAQADIAGPFTQRPSSAQAAAEGLSLMMKAMEDLDAPENMPEGLDRATWDRFCQARRAKVESEHQVKMKALTLAEMQAFLQRRTDEDENTRVEIKNLIDDLNGLREERMRFHLDVMVQVLLKQGQTEVEPRDFIADYSDSVLLDRGVVEDLNSIVRALGKQKIASMVECKDFRKGILQQEWENWRMRMLMEDLSNRARDIQMLRVTQEIQEYLSELGCNNQTSKQVSSLEKTMSLEEKIHAKNVLKCKELIKQLSKKAALKAKQNAELDLQLASMRVTVAERGNLLEATAMEEDLEQEAEECYHGILQRKRLVAQTKAQAVEVAILGAEVERMRRKAFPALLHLKDDAY